MTPLFKPSRQAGLEQLTTFALKAGRAYAAGRNSDVGPGAATAVSMLSPYLRRRMITEHEVAKTVLQHHSLEAAEKFVQEVFWRTYFKGWLEMRPSIWDHYMRERACGFRDLDIDAALRRDYTAAVEGRTGIEGFDDWAHELVETGWLHNHARMWFASIWIFTLRLPWALGADFFYHHLVDADPASNTLSWRWVGGLHTKGKTYLARADNIEKYTNGRFRPTDLAPFAVPLIEDFETPAPLPPRDAPTRVPDGDYALLLTTDDLHPESWPGYADNPPVAVLVMGAFAEEADLNNGGVARKFTASALDEAANRLGAPVARVAPNSGDVLGHVARLSAPVLALPHANSGPGRPFLDALKAGSTDAGIAIHEVKRSWDVHAWPRATAGFFKMKKAMPKLLGQAGLAA